MSTNKWKIPCFKWFMALKSSSSIIVRYTASALHIITEIKCYLRNWSFLLELGEPCYISLWWCNSSWTHIITVHIGGKWGVIVVLCKLLSHMCMFLWSFVCLINQLEAFTGLYLLLQCIAWLSEVIDRPVEAKTCNFWTINKL